MAGAWAGGGGALSASDSTEGPPSTSSGTSDFDEEDDDDEDEDEENEDEEDDDGYEYSDGEAVATVPAGAGGGGAAAGSGDAGGVAALSAGAARQLRRQYESALLRGALARGYAKSAALIFKNSCTMVSSSNGKYPASSTKTMTPRLHTSACLPSYPWFSNTSGAT